MIKIDINSYEFRERLAILVLNNPDMHPNHAWNKAKKEIMERSEYEEHKQERQG